LKGIEITTRSTLDWIDIVDSSEEIAKICVAVEIIKGSNELTKTVNGLNVPLLNHIQPKLHNYRLVFSLKIEHKIIYIYYKNALQTNCFVLGIT
jgi:hypothetical protein